VGTGLGSVLLVAEFGAPTVVAITVGGCHVIVLICGLG
jgi:hypothetical protein